MVKKSEETSGKVAKRAAKPEASSSKKIQKDSKSLKKSKTASERKQRQLSRRFHKLKVTKAKQGKFVSMFL